MKDSPQYSDHLDVLLALITYLALTRWRSRSPNGLALDLGLDEKAVTRALDGFPWLVSPEQKASANGCRAAAALHARYAQRRPRPEGTSEALSDAEDQGSPSLSAPQPVQDSMGEELDTETLRALLDL